LSTIAGPLLVTTKLHVPQPRRGLVPRPDLVARLTTPGARRLILLSAPAGWGKTALLSEWHASPDEHRPFAWVSLDRGDSDPVRFWSYVIGALNTIDEKLGETALAALPDVVTDLDDSVVAPLINDLAACGRELVLVLDDYHHVRSEPIHSSLSYLLAHLPHDVELAVATRADPPLPLAGLRAAGEMIEIRAATLRFSDSEADALLNGSLGLRLEPAEVDVLQARTEGWAAGLQLAALSVRAHEDRHAFIAEFAGDDRQIGDYLHEVLDDQPAAVRAFLLQTSILERLCAPLCDAVTGSGDARRQLTMLERSNLFLVSLDSRRDWYRYHQLFRDLLRSELDLVQPELAQELHRRAAGWHRQAGNLEEAIEHATVGGDFDEARSLIRRHVEETSVLGQYETVARWIDAIPRSAVRADASLCATRAWCALHLGRLDEAASWRREFEPADGSLAGAPAEGSAPEFRVISFDAAFAARRGDVGRASEAGRRIVAFYSETDPRRAYASMNLAEELFYAGDLSSAAASLDAGVRQLSGAEPSPLINQEILHGHAFLAAVRAEQGDIGRAERSIAAGERLIGGVRQGERHPHAIVLAIARGRLFELRGDLDAAEATLTRAEELARRVSWPLDHAYSLLLLARVEHALGKQTEARAAARLAHDVLRPCPDPGMLGELLARTERILRLAPGPATPKGSAAAELSEREVTILRLLASELSQREIGSELYISLNTVKRHVRNIFHKLGVSSRPDAVARGQQLGLI